MQETSSDSEAQVDERGPRERILSAALNLFVQQGYFNTNVPDISRQSKCSVGSIYHHFLNKEEIADHLYRGGIEEFRTALNASISDPKNIESTVSEIVSSFLSFAEQNPKLSQYLWLARHNEFLSDSVRKPTTVGFDSLGRKITKAIKTGIRNDTIGAVKAEIFWSIVFGIPLSYVRDWLDGYTSESPEQVAPTLAKACWAALQASR